MRTITKTVYKFDELSKDAQQRAIQGNSGVNTDYLDWYAGIYEAFKEYTSEFEVDDIKFSGFYSQDDGAMFEYSAISTALFHEAVDSLTITEKRKQFIKDNCILWGRGKQAGHYSHEKSCDHDIELEFASPKYLPTIELFLDEAHTHIKDFVIQRYEKLARKLYDDLTSEYEYLESEEIIKETIIESGWEFYEDGTTI